MKKVLIISYFYPPCNLTASQRIKSWTNYLPDGDYYPVVITRKWERHIGSFTDCHYGTSDGVNIEQNENHEVHNLPYIPNMRDRVHTSGKKKMLSKILTFKELILQNVNVKACPYSNMYYYARDYMREHDDVELLIISGNPFLQFSFGHKLNKEFGVKWIADYRDAWTTSTINNLSGGKLMKLVDKYNRRFEKKWVGSASLVTSSSKSIGDSITALTKTPSEAIYNGYEPKDFLPYSDVAKNTEHFQIAYIGTLYDGQNVEIFLEAYKQFIDAQKPKSILLFPGLNLNRNQKERIEKAMSGYEDYYRTTDRVPKEEILEMEVASHVLLHVAWNEHKGIIASKIYEYLGSGTDILICPGDNDAIDQIVKESGSGTITYSTDEALSFINKQYEAFCSGKLDQTENKSVNNTIFTRENQAKELIKLMNRIS